MVRSCSEDEEPNIVNLPKTLTHLNENDIID